MPTISSPCTKICTIDPRSELCIGCGRTMFEIGRWAGFSEADRLRIMAELPNRRRAAYGMPPLDEPGR